MQLQDLASMAMVPGVALVLLVLTIPVLIYLSGRYNILTESQALGLPRGSVRALIAFAALFLFTTFAFLIISWANGPGTSVYSKAGANIAEIEVLTEGLIVVKEEQGGATTAVEVVNVGNASQAANVANQTLTMVGTLLTTIVAFYFGTRAAASGSAAGTAATESDPATPDTADGMVVTGIAGALSRIKKAQNRIESLRTEAATARAGIKDSTKLVMVKDNFDAIEAAATRIAGSSTEAEKLEALAQKAVEDGKPTEAAKALNKVRGLVKSVTTSLTFAEESFRRTKRIIA